MRRGAASAAVIKTRLSGNCAARGFYVSAGRAGAMLALDAPPRLSAPFPAQPARTLAGRAWRAAAGKRRHGADHNDLSLGRCAGRGALLRYPAPGCDGDPAAVGA